MIINFLNRFNFSRILILIFNNIEKSLKKDFILLCLKNFIASILELFLIIFSGSLIQIFVEDKNKDIVEIPKILSILGINEYSNIQISLLFIVISLFTTIFSFYVKCDSIYVSNNISNQVNSNLIKSFLSIQYNKYTELSTDILQLSAGYAQSLAKSIIAYVEIIKGSISVIIISLGVYYATFQNGLFIIFFIFILYSLILLNTKKLFIKISQEMRDSEGEFLKLINTTYGGFRDIKFSGFTEYIKYQLIQKDKGIKSLRAKAYILNIAPKSLLEFIFFISLGLIFVLYSLNFNILSIKAYELIIIVVAGLKLIPQFQTMFSLFSSLKSTSYQIASIYEFIDFCKKNESKKGRIILGSKNNSINSKTLVTLKDISYRYPNSKNNVLKNINLSINESEWIAIQGTTGSGKSTLLDILLNLLEPSNGETIYFSDKKNSSSYFSHVAQFPFLFIDNIYRNIVGYENRRIDNDLFEKCLYYSCLDEDIKNGMLNLDDKVGERGSKISGGQRQRIGIARALYFHISNNSKIIVLDECTSALDEITSNKVMKRLSSIKPKLTLISVTHRNEILENFDTIYSMQYGIVSKKNF